MEKSKNNLSVMLKPSSGKCNMGCAYCFYRGEAAARNKGDFGDMSVLTAKRCIDAAAEYKDGEKSIIFQGGEPLLRGKDFYREVLDYAKGRGFSFGLQTNGLCLDGEWCDIFKTNGVLVGLSLDGDAADNRYRTGKNGESTFAQVSRALKLLQDKGVEHNVSVVVSHGNVERIRDIFDFFVGQGERYLQFIPCLKTAEHGLAMTSDVYGSYLLRLFDCYYRAYRDGNYVSVRCMDNYVRLAKHLEAEQCGMNGCCGRQFVVEANGDVFPCDFYCTDGYLLGNIHESDFFQLERTPQAVDFLRRREVPKRCRECRYYTLCKGGCRRENEDFDRCEGQKAFFDYALPYLKSMN